MHNSLRFLSLYSIYYYYFLLKVILFFSFVTSGWYRDYGCIFNGLPSGTILHLQLVVSWQNMADGNKKEIISFYFCSSSSCTQYINNKKSHFNRDLKYLAE